MSFTQRYKGERVVLMENYGTRKAGDTGTVVSFEGFGSYGENLIKVQMDKASPTGSYNMECYNRRLGKAAPVPAAPAPLDVIAMIVQSADKIFPRRSLDTILKSQMEEVGELSTEIAIQQGTKKRAPSADGVKGEAIDVFVVAVDMLRATWGDAMFTPQFTEAVARKLAKWEGK